MENEARDGLTVPTEPVYSALPQPSSARADFGRFELVRMLGEGAMGVVFEARDTETNALVALKALRAADAGLLYRLKQEFRAIADVRHPNLVRLYELHSVDGLWFFTMERIDGVALNQWVRPRAGGFDEQRVRAAFAQLWSGITAIHERGTLHRDLKPSNVLVTSSGRVVILDFGLASDPRPGSAAVTPESLLAGTPAYMAPEQKAGMEIGEASDWYAMGVMLYESLTGERPTADLRSPAALCSDVPPDLDALCQYLLATDAQQRPTAKEIGAALSVGSTTSRSPTGARPFVGRSDELGRLQDALLETDRGKPIVAWIEGSSGIGKTALVERFAADAATHARVLYGRCHEREAVPYKALDGLIDHLCRQLRGMLATEVAAVLPRDAVVLGQVFPVLMRVAAFQEAARDARAIVPDQHEQRRRAIVALKELLRRLALRRPLVIVIDDMHWGDIDSAHLLGALLRPPDAPAALLVGCYRAEEAREAAFLRSLLAAVEDASVGAIRIALGPLNPSESEQLAAQLLEDLDGAPVSALVREAAGVPFFIGQLVQYAQSGASRQVPIDLEGVLSARIASLTADAQRLLAFIVLAARPLPLAMARVLVPACADACDLLSGARMIRIGSDGSLRAYHDRVREHVIRTLAPDVARAYHCELAAAFELAAEPLDDALTAHLLAAGEAQRAAAYAQRAANRAAEQLAFDRAADLYATALQGAAQHERQGLLVRRADALASCGRSPQAAKCYLDAAELADYAQSISLRARAAEMYLTSGAITEGLAVVRPLLEAVRLKYPESPHRAVASALYDHVWLRLFGVRPACRTATPDELARIDVCLSVAAGLLCVDEGRSIGLALRGLRLAVKAGDALRVCRALPMYAHFVRTTKGTPQARETAIEYFRTARRMAEALGDVRLVLWCEVSEAMTEVGDGEWSVTRAKIDRWASAPENTLLSGFALFTVHFVEQATLAFRGEMAALKLCAPEHMHQGYARGDLLDASLSRIFRAWARVAADECDAVFADLEATIAMWSSGVRGQQHHGQAFSTVEALGRLVWLYARLYRGEAGLAYQELNAMWPKIEASTLLYTHAWSAVFHMLRGCVLLTRLGDPHDGARCADQVRACIERLRRLQRPRWSKAAACLLDAGLLLESGQPALAIEELQRAEEVFEAEFMSLHAASCRRRWGALVGGAVGAGVVVAADQRMALLGVKDPMRWTGAYAPGFEPSTVEH